MMMTAAPFFSLSALELPKSALSVPRASAVNTHFRIFSNTLHGNTRM